MAKKMYFSFKPECFSIYDTVSREGELKFRNCDSFDIKDSFFDRIIFEAPRKRLKGTINAKDIITKNKIKIKFVPETSESQGYVKAFSNKLNLVSDGYILPDDAVIENSSVTGFFNALTEDQKLKEDYVMNVVQFYITAKVQKTQYLKDEEGPDRKKIQEIRKLSRKLK